MNKAVLLDTNILLDAAMGERSDWAYAGLLLDEIAYGKLDAYIVATSLKDVYYVLGKYAGESVAREFVGAALDAFTVVGVDDCICRLAINLNEPDFEDSIIRACAEKVGVDFIISRDEGAFRASPIKRFSSREFVDLFCDVSEVPLRE